MNHTTAEAIATLAKDLIESIDKTKIPLPAQHWTKWTHDDIDLIYLDDGYLTVKWSRYRGCGESDRQETTLSLDTVFDY